MFEYLKDADIPHLFSLYCGYNKVPGTRQQSLIALAGGVLIYDLVSLVLIYLPSLFALARNIK
jgi:hypothetical protein